MQFSDKATRFLLEVDGHRCFADTVTELQTDLDNLKARVPFLTGKTVSIYRNDETTLRLVKKGIVS